MSTDKELKKILKRLGVADRKKQKSFLDLISNEVSTSVDSAVLLNEKKNALCAISPIDGRYAEKTTELKGVFSEFGLFKYRVIVEIKWLEFLLRETTLIGFSEEEMKTILSIPTEFDVQSAMRIKEIEGVTNHDVNAVVEYIKEQLNKKGLEKFSGYVHLFLTSEDLNNASYSMMLKEGGKILGVEFLKFSQLIADKAEKWKHVVMLGHTHGQPAIPTTMGKEFMVFDGRFSLELSNTSQWKPHVKWNGATGTYSAHVFACPEIDWITKSKHFVGGYLHAEHIPVSTQINPHHDVAELLQIFIRIAGTIVDMSSDMWMYISMGYLKQKPKPGEVGSSTMPHKVNPIDWENARGNAKIAIGLSECLSRELLVSTMQRDLSDSTLQRSLGSVFSHMLIAVKSCEKAMGKIDVDLVKINKDLKDNPEVITEAIQVLLRVLGVPDAYNKLKELSRGKKLTKKILKEFVDRLDIQKKYKRRILSITPAKYSGLCSQIVDDALGN